MMDAMASNFVRLTVIADDNQLDVSLPAHRPIAEYIDDVLDLLGPASAAPATTWTLSSPKHGTMDLEDTLADHALADGAELHLTKSAQAAAPPFVDDVIAEMRREVSTEYRTWIPPARTRWIAAAIGAALLAGGAIVVARPDRGVVAATLAAIALFAAIVGVIGRRNALGHVVWAAVPLAAAAAWRGAEDLGVAESVSFALAGAAVVVALGGFAVLRTVSVALTATICAVVFAVAGAAFALGANPTAASVWAAPVLVVMVIVAPNLALSSSGLLAQIRLSEQMELADRSAIAAGMARGRTTADILVWTSSILVVPVTVTTALTGVWQQGLAAGFLLAIWLLRSRNFTHARHVGPMVVASATGCAALAAAIVGWLGATGASQVALVGVAAVVVALCFVLGALPALEEVSAARMRRLLDAIDLPLAIAFIPIVFFAQGVYGLVWPK